MNIHRLIFHIRLFPVDLKVCGTRSFSIVHKLLDISRFWYGIIGFQENYSTTFIINKLSRYGRITIHPGGTLCKLKHHSESGNSYIIYVTSCEKIPNYRRKHNVIVFVTLWHYKRKHYQVIKDQYYSCQFILYQQ